LNTPPPLCYLGGWVCYRYGHDRCSLYKENVESIQHLLLVCSWYVQVWQEVEGMSSYINVWTGTSIEDNLKSLCGILLARNASIFKDKFILLMQFATQNISILNSFKQLKSKKTPR
jgi:hypothetical protein